MLSDRALEIVRNSPEGVGAEVWRKLPWEYEPGVGIRYGAMLQSLFAHFCFWLFLLFLVEGFSFSSVFVWVHFPIFHFFKIENFSHHDTHHQTAPNHPTAQHTTTQHRTTQPPDTNHPPEGGATAGGRGDELPPEEGGLLPIGKGGGGEPPAEGEMGRFPNRKGWSVNCHQRGLRANHHRWRRAEVNHVGEGQPPPKGEDWGGGVNHCHTERWRGIHL